MSDYTGEIHATLTEDRLIELIEARATSLDNPGVCMACGADHDACEPDARGYECHECGEKFVYGAEEIFMSGAYHG